jgi:hypothetical protein
MAAIQALVAEALVWQQSAGTMRAAKNAVDGLGLGESELSWASRPTGLVDTYGQIQAKVSTLLGAGAQTFTELGTAIDTAAAGYQRDEDDAVHRMLNVW